MEGAAQVVERYDSAWVETDPARPRALLEETCAPDGGLSDPNEDTTGLDLDAYIADLQGSLGEYRSEITTRVDERGNYFRFS